MTTEEKAHVLIVDDSEIILASFGLWLKSKGFSVHTAKNRDEAIRLVKSEPISVCLVDLMLKNENGLDVSQEIKLVDDLIRIIIFTSFPTYDSALDTIKSGFFDYVSKSDDNDLILKKIESAIADRETQLSPSYGDPDRFRNIILVCHHILVKEGLIRFCDLHPEYRLLHTYYDLDTIKKADFNIYASMITICHECCDLSNIDDLKRLELYFPNAKLMLINCHVDKETKLTLLKSGVTGFVHNNLGPTGLKKHLDTLYNDEISGCSELKTTEIMEAIKSQQSIQIKPELFPNISKRETEVLQAVSSGLSNSEIANKLFLSEKTVKTHIHNIFKKLDVKTRTEAVMTAIEKKIL